jgi:anti-sigma regulatory factor (Ser/Thr protein kinase)
MGGVASRRRHRNGNLAVAGRYGETADLTIYRTIQEALTNVFRHAGATCVNVTVEPVELPSGLTGRGGALVRVATMAAD